MSINQLGLKATIKKFLNGSVSIDSLEEALGLMSLLEGKLLYATIANDPNFVAMLKKTMFRNNIVNHGTFHEIKEFLLCDDNKKELGLDYLSDDVINVFIIVASRAICHEYVAYYTYSRLPIMEVKAAVAAIVDFMFDELNKEEDDDASVMETNSPVAGDVDCIIQVLENLAIQSHDGHYYLRLTGKCKERLIGMLHEDGMITRV